MNNETYNDESIQARELSEHELKAVSGAGNTGQVCNPYPECTRPGPIARPDP